tara:strand:+ start:1226 stop:1477 length:252 start_codon:yes stop_codon:yes gene_type:complete
MEKITKKQVDSKVKFLNEEYDLNLDIERSTGYGTKIVSHNGSHRISCNGTDRDIYYQLQAVEEVLRIKFAPYQGKNKLVVSFM